MGIYQIFQIVGIIILISTFVVCSKIEKRNNITKIDLADLNKNQKKYTNRINFAGIMLLVTYAFWFGIVYCSPHLSELIKQVLYGVRALATVGLLAMAYYYFTLKKITENEIQIKNNV